MIDLILEKMICESQGKYKKTDIAHFLKVHSYAHLIGKKEKIDERTQLILEIAAIVHDIACPLCREKYGNSQGHYQELEGPKLVRSFLEQFHLDNDIVTRVAYLVGHHHTYQNVDGLDYQILLEADFLVNADEMDLNKDAILTMKDCVFQTKTGKLLLKTIYDL